MVVANTGDDFEHLGLAISPDIDTLMYVLAGLDDPERGWGRRDETWTSWRRSSAGRRDLVPARRRRPRHACRAHAAARRGESLSQSPPTSPPAGDRNRIVPMTDDQVRTRLGTDEGWLEFQDYFVRRRCEPVVTNGFEDARRARPSRVLEALRDPELRAVVICPSNPFVSIDPILAFPGCAKPSPPAPRRSWRCRRSSAAAPSRVPPPR